MLAQASGIQVPNIPFVLSFLLHTYFSITVIFSVNIGYSQILEIL